MFDTIVELITGVFSAILIQEFWGGFQSYQIHFLKVGWSFCSANGYSLQSPM